MTEGKGYCARLQERKSQKRLADFVRNRNEILVIPDLPDMKSKPKKSWKEKRTKPLINKN